MIFCQLRLKNSVSVTCFKPSWWEDVLQQCPSSKWYQPQSFGATLPSWPLKVYPATNFGKGSCCSSRRQAEDTSNMIKLVFRWSQLCLFCLKMSKIYISFLQSPWGVPCHICWNCAIQNNSNVYHFPNNLFANLFWAYLGSNCWGYVSFDDYAAGSGKTIHSAQVFQRGTPSRLGRSRVWRGSSFAIQSCSSMISVQLNNH